VRGLDADPCTAADDPGRREHGAAGRRGAVLPSGRAVARRLEGRRPPSRRGPGPGRDQQGLRADRPQAPLISCPGRHQPTHEYRAFRFPEPPGSRVPVRRLSAPVPSLGAVPAPPARPTSTPAPGGKMTAGDHVLTGPEARDERERIRELLLSGRPDLSRRLQTGPSGALLIPLPAGGGIEIGRMRRRGRARWVVVARRGGRARGREPATRAAPVGWPGHDGPARPGPAARPPSPQWRRRPWRPWRATTTPRPRSRSVSGPPVSVDVMSEISSFASRHLATVIDRPEREVYDYI